MADEVELNAGSGGAKIATDTIGAKEFATSKITIGADGVDGGFVSSANPLPVGDAGGSVTVDAPVETPVFVRLSDGSAAIGTLPVSGTFWQATQPVSGTVAVSNTGFLAAQSGSWTVAATQSGTWTVTGAGGTFPVTDSGGSLTVDAPVATPVFVRLSDGSAAITTLPVSLASVPSHAVTNAGTFAVQAAQSGTWTAVPNAATFGGATPYFFIAAAGSDQDSTVVKNGAGQLYSVSGFSVGTAPRYLKLYDKATGPTSADTPKHVFQIPSQGTANGSGFTFAVPVGLVFSSGISFRITTGIANNDSTATTGGDTVINLGYA